VADLVHAIQNSSEWAHTAIIITYDENGGFWDQASPPKLGDSTWGDGTRVPAIVISPYAKQGFVDHSQHDTLSILKTIEDRFDLKPLNNLDKNATSLANDFQSTPHASFGSAYAQRDADNPGKFALIVQGTEGNDKITISEDSGNIEVKIKGPGVNYDHFFAQAFSRLEIYGQGGNDTITVDPNVTIPAFIFAGNGNDTIKAGGGPSVVVGGSGNNTLTGGSGLDILIAGDGRSKLTAGPAGAILIAGTTNFDANLDALKGLEAEWSRTDETYAQKLAHLNGGATGGKNGSFILDETTVDRDDAGPDDLTGGKGKDWFFAHLAGKKKDKIHGMMPGEIVTEI
jgi:Ca2+-binding RTX toxin-like protein